MGMKPRNLYAWITLGGSVGLLASFIELVEYQILLKNAHSLLACDINNTFSCSPVLTAWQSSVFGFPNAMLCMVFFTTMLVAGLVGVTGGQITRALRWVLQGLALFFLGFALWFFWQSIFAIGALCILCLICFGGLLVLNASWLRMNVGAAATQPSSFWGKCFQSGADLFSWTLIGLALLATIYLRFH